MISWGGGNVSDDAMVTVQVSRHTRGGRCSDLQVGVAREVSFQILVSQPEPRQHQQTPIGMRWAMQPECDYYGGQELGTQSLAKKVSKGCGAEVPPC